MSIPAEPAPGAPLQVTGEHGPELKTLPGGTLIRTQPAAPTQVRRPWKATVRTVFQAVVGAAPLAPFVYEAATHHDPAAATGLAATGLAVAAGVTRVMALPQVEAWLQRWAPWLAAEGRPGA